MTIDFYMPVDCIWYSLIALYLVGYVVFARKIYASILTMPDDTVDKVFSAWISIIGSIIWPMFFVASIMFYGIRKKNENN